MKRIMMALFALVLLGGVISVGVVLYRSGIVRNYVALDPGA